MTGRRERVATPDEAKRLIDALPEEDRALWATAFYAGLRRGELRALRAEDVNSTYTLITVRRGWDDVQGEIRPKSEKGERKVPIPAILRVGFLPAMASGCIIGVGRQLVHDFFGERAAVIYDVSVGLVSLYNLYGAIARGARDVGYLYRYSY